MPDFTTRLTSGVTVQLWTDPATEQRPSRINWRAQSPARRYVGVVGQKVEIRATVDGTEGPPDSALDGRLFVAWFVERPPPIQWFLPTTASSIVRFIPSAPGHYTVGFRRPDGGIEHVHMDVIQAEDA